MIKEGIGNLFFWKERGKKNRSWHPRICNKGTNGLRQVLEGYKLILISVLLEKHVSLEYGKTQVLITRYKEIKEISNCVCL